MIRPLLAADAELAAHLIRTAFAALDTPLDPPPSALRVTGDIVRAHLHAGGRGALSGSHGCVLWAEQADGIYLSRLAVLPAARGRGVAAALLAHVEAAARAAGIKWVRLEVRLALEGNRRLFARAGFVEGERLAHPGFEHPTYLKAAKRII